MCHQLVTKNHSNTKLYPFYLFLLLETIQGIPTIFSPHYLHYAVFTWLEEIRCLSENLGHCSNIPIPHLYNGPDVAKLDVPP